MSGSRVVFVREATGLVREISPYQLMIFNFLTAPIVTTLMWSLNWNPNMFPGFDFNTGLLIIALLAVPMYLTYCIVYTAFPKTGTDYVFQSRVLNPGIGFSATFAAWVFFQFWYISLNGISIVEMFLVPWLFAIAQGTNNAGYAAIANALATTNSMAILSFVAVIAAGLIVMGGIRMYLKIQTVLFCFAAAAVIALLVLLASTSNSAFASNLSTNLSGLIGSSDVYNKIIGTAQGEGINLSPTVTLYASIGAMITPWTFALEWTVFGNLGLCGEMKTANQFKTQAITMLGALALVVVGLFAAWNLFIGMTGQNFWYAAATLAWNADPLFGKLPALVYSMPASFFLLYGTNNLALATVWAIGGAITIFATNFTIYMLVSRMLFAQTFDRLFPAPGLHNGKESNSNLHYDCDDHSGLYMDLRKSVLWIDSFNLHGLHTIHDFSGHYTNNDWRDNLSDEDAASFRTITSSELSGFYCSSRRTGDRGEHSHHVLSSNRTCTVGYNSAV